MKKIVAVFLFLSLILSLYSCGGQTAVIEETFSLAETPVVREGEKLLSTNGAKTVELHFAVPENGYFKLRAFDSSENDNEDHPTATLSFLNANGAVIADGLTAESGYAEQVKVEKGDLTARLVFSKGYAKMEQISVCWAFAPDTDTANEVKVDGGAVVARVNADKQAAFRVKITEIGTYQIYMNESCLSEGDCAFYVKKDGAPITEELYIHGSEWIWRRLFLTPGEYELVGTNLGAVAECEVKLEEKAADVQLKDIANAALPVKVGFVIGESERTVTFTAADSGLLVIEAIGSCTDNDGGQTFAATVTDSVGYSETQEECVGDATFDLAKFSGEVTVNITLTGGGIATLRIYHPESE